MLPPGKGGLFKLDEDDDDEPMFGAGLKKATDNGNKYQ
jgi:hypothetical protein